MTTPANTKRSLHFVASAWDRLLLTVLVCASLAACERTAFQSPPSDSTRCDKALVGHWLSEGDAGRRDGELVAFVDAECNLRVDEYRSEGIRTSAKTALRSDRIGSERYLWLDADWAHRSFEIEPGALAVSGDVYLFSYATSGRNRLLLHAPRHRAIAHRVLDRDISGEIIAREDSLSVRIPGDSDAIAALLRKYRLFDLKNGLGFRRADGDEARR
jgi:hypothetical protein